MSILQVDLKDKVKEMFFNLKTDDFRVIPDQCSTGSILGECSLVNRILCFTLKMPGGMKRQWPS